MNALSEADVAQLDAVVRFVRSVLGGAAPRCPPLRIRRRIRPSTGRGDALGRAGAGYLGDREGSWEGDALVAAAPTRMRSGHRSASPPFPDQGCVKPSIQE